MDWNKDPGVIPGRASAFPPSLYEFKSHSSYEFTVQIPKYVPLGTVYVIGADGSVVST